MADAGSSATVGGVAVTVRRWPLLPEAARRVLPVRVRLVHAETPASLWSRLARANHLAAPGLRRALPDGQRGRARGELSELAVLSGYPVELLARVLIRHDDGTRELRRACPRCLARRGITRPVEVRCAVHRPLCRRHRRWLSPVGPFGHPDGPVIRPLDLAAVPDVLTAQRRHTQLIRHHRDDDRALLRAWWEAQYVLLRWTAHSDWPQHRTRRLRPFVDLDHWRISEYNPIMAMANYPETVTLTGLLTDPAWTEQLIERGAAGWQQFTIEVARRLRFGHRPDHGGWEPLRRIVDQRVRAAQFWRRWGHLGIGVSMPG